MFIISVGRVGLSQTTPFYVNLTWPKGLTYICRNPVLGLKLSDKSCAEFSHYIAESEREKIRKKISQASYISVIFDGSVDRSVQESEIVYIRYCYKGRIFVNFSTVKNIPGGDSESIAHAMIDGMKILCGDNYGEKIVATETDGTSSN